MKKKVIHVISHSHWDREWYMPFEKHRIGLIKLLDDCMELFEAGNGFESFHLDGQTIILDDYLQIKPENLESIKRFVKEGRFHIGPWYILQDEFLTTGESNVRNLLFGIEEAKKFGKVCNIGYFPDAFGNAGQMPQLLKQAGMEAVIFGRGVKPIGFNNKVGETDKYESFYSEMIWKAPDGSGLLGILFANWYNNGNEIPDSEKEAREFWDKKLQEVLQYSSTDHLLLMNGCDHQPVQKNIASAIALANSLYPEYEFRHSNFIEYINCLDEVQENRLSTVTGELTSQSTDGWTTLVNTASSRIYLKQLNRDNEVALINHSEPLAAIASEIGAKYPHSALEYSWKKLMQNHPHDSICGCSVDEVHEEMMIRHRNSIEICQELMKESMDFISGNIDTTIFGNEEANPFTVFNTSGWDRTGAITAYIDICKLYQENLNTAFVELSNKHLGDFILVDNHKQRVECTMEDMGVRFDYDLPNDKFRKPYMSRYIKVTFEADTVPSMGYKTYALLRSKEISQGGSLNHKEKELTKVKSSMVIPKGMENDYLKATINQNGSINILQKESGRLYKDVCYYEDTGDIGNEYIYRQPIGDQAVLSKDISCTYELIEDEPYRITYQITHELSIPESANELLQEETRNMTNVRQRRAKRSSILKPLVITTFISLEKEGHGIKVRTEFDNEMKNHRIRAIFPTGINVDSHFAESVFEIVKRSNRHSNSWDNPSGCEHQQCFCGICDQKEGIVIANYGLYEYELLPDKNNAIAITLLRSVGEMGDWGVFLTPGAQCLGKTSVTFEIIPYSPNSKTFDPIIEAYQFQFPMKVYQQRIGSGILPIEKSFFQWHGDGIYLTGMKNKKNSSHHVIRFVNSLEKGSLLTVKVFDKVKKYYKSNVMEEFIEEINVLNENSIQIMLKPYEIFTLGVE